jgi:hypothetical protein
MVVPWGNLSLVLLGTWFFLIEQLKPLYILGIFFHPFHSWMKKIIQEKFQTQNLWGIKRILAIVLVFYL